MLKFIAGVLACLLAASSCKPHGPGPDIPATPKPAETITLTATRLYVRDNCVLGYQQAGGREFAAFLAPFIPVLIDKAYTGLVAAFRRAGSDTVTQKRATRPMYLYAYSDAAENKGLQLNPKFRCLILVDGEFNKDGGDDTPGSEPTVKEPHESPTSAEAAVRMLNDASIPVSNAHVVYEAMVRPSDDGTALFYSSRFLMVNQFLGAERGESARGLVVNLNLIGAGSKPDDPVLSSAMINLGELTAGTILGPKELASSRSEWAGGIGISQQSQDAFKQLGSNVKLYMPVTATGVFAETKKGNAIAKFIADVLDGAKKDMEDAANKAMNPVERAAAAKTSTADTEAALKAEESAYEDYLKAKAAGTDTELKKFELARATRIWCNAYKAATKLGTVKGDRDKSACAQ